MAFVSEDFGVTAGQPGLLFLLRFSPVSSGTEPQPSLDWAAPEEVCQTAGDLVLAVARGDQFLSRGSCPGSS